jgi:hypothetical protein
MICGQAPEAIYLVFFVYQSPLFWRKDSILGILFGDFASIGHRIASSLAVH